jgi:hypothetical protein
MGTPGRTWPESIAPATCKAATLSLQPMELAIRSSRVINRRATASDLVSYQDARELRTYSPPSYGLCAGWARPVIALADLPSPS